MSEKCLRVGALLGLVLAMPFFAFAQRGDFQERYTISAEKTLRVNIDIDAAKVRIFPSPREREARVELHYGERDFDVYVDYDEARSRLDIEFDKKDWVDADHDNIEARVVIELPAGVETELDARIKAGDVDIDLGGLSLIGMDLTTWAGEVTLEFPEPNKTEMDYLKVNTKVGETEILRLGNARFRSAEIDGGIGEMRIDFRGALLTESRVEIDLDLGETSVVLPQDAGIKLSISKFLFMTSVDLPRGFSKSGRHYYSRNFDEAKTRLIMKLSPGLGELSIDY